MPSPLFPLRSIPPDRPPAVRYGAGAGGTPNACCAAGAPIEHPHAHAVRAARRSTLADLDPHLHCSIVGTCLTTAELRKLVPRHAPHIDRKHASDLEIHHAAVALCCDGGPGRKEINKALDARHALAIRRFKAAAEPEALRGLWTAAMASGDVPGAYWSLVTHPHVTPALRALAFGDVHMLSHLVGAANRADIRRLVALEDECAQLKAQGERQQARLRDLNVRHAGEMRALALEMETLAAERRAPVPPADVAAELDRLRAALAERDDRLALHAARRADAERRAEANANLVRALELRVDQAEDAARQARADAATLEAALQQTLDPDAPATALPPLQGHCIAYVGGRPGTTAVLGELVRAAGAEWLAHDGGIEDRKTTLAALLPRATLVLFPVDCIGHNAMDIVKRTCTQAGIPYQPLRSASVASAIVALQRLQRLPAPAEPAGQAPRSRFCLRHG